MTKRDFLRDLQREINDVAAQPPVDRGRGYILGLRMKGEKETYVLA
jgi:hypothetical protein